MLHTLSFSESQNQNGVLKYGCFTPNLDDTFLFQYLFHISAFLKMHDFQFLPCLVSDVQVSQD